MIRSGARAPRRLERGRAPERRAGPLSIVPGHRPPGAARSAAGAPPQVGVLGPRGRRGGLRDKGVGETGWHGSSPTGRRNGASVRCAGSLACAERRSEQKFSLNRKENGGTIHGGWCRNKQHPKPTVFSRFLPQTTVPHPRVRWLPFGPVILASARVRRTGCFSHRRGGLQPRGDDPIVPSGEGAALSAGRSPPRHHDEVPCAARPRMNWRLRCATSSSSVRAPPG